MMSSICCERKGHWVSSSFVMIIFFVLLNGCATLKTTSDDTKDVVAPIMNEEPKEVKMKEFVLGPDDKMDIEVYRHDVLKRTIQIGHSGRIAYPLVGKIRAGGLTVPQLRDRIRAGLAKYIVDPRVFISISSVRSQSVVVLGEAKSPGLFNLDVLLTSLQPLVMAGGFSGGAKLETILLVRGG